MSIELTKFGEILETVSAHLAKKVDQKCQTICQSVSSTLERIEGALNKSNERIDRRLEEIEQKIQLTHQKLLNKSDENLNVIMRQLKSKEYCEHKPEVCDCSDIKASGFTTSEVYRVYVIDSNRRYYADAYCDMTTANNSWLIFQKRKDGSEEFYRGWTDYANGFGDPNGEYWLGNEFLHILTSKRTYRLRIDMENFEGESRYAEYAVFNIQSADNNYTLTIGNYSGDAGDSMIGYHNNQQFSTFDHSNSFQCAELYHGAWWYNHCHWSNLNGRYLRGNHSTYADGINWFNWHGHHYSLKTTEMKLAPFN